MRLSDLEAKDVVDVRSGKKLGFVSDLELDDKDLCILCLLVCEVSWKDFILIFSKPKLGKPSALAELPGALCIDLEDGGYDYIDAVKVKATSVSDIKEICKAIKEANFPYKFIVLDTITALEEMVKPTAIQLYRNSPQASDKYADVTDPTLLPNGSGYSFIRIAIEKVIDMFASVVPNIILCGHVKDVSLNEGLDGTVKDLDLVGKTKRILSAKSDAIGFVHRDDDGNLCINFGQEDVLQR